MDHDGKGLADHLEVFRRRKWEMLLPTVLIFALGMVIASQIPPIFRSEATILVEQQEIPPELVQSTVTSYADKRIQIISKRVMTSTNLLAIIEKFDLYPEQRQTAAHAAALERIRKDIQLDMISADVVNPQTGRPSEATIAFIVSFQTATAETAQSVTSELASLYLNQNLQSRTQSVAETADFLAAQARRVNAEVVRLEKELSDYRTAHSSYLPELMIVHLDQMDRAERELMDLRRNVRSLEDRRIFLDAELAQLQPNAIMYSADGSRIMSPQDRFESLRAEYIGLSARYSEDHPTLIAMRAEMDSLRAELGGGADTTKIEGELRALRSELTAKKERYAADHPDIRILERSIGHLQARLQRESAAVAPLPTSKPDNPAYIQIQAQLWATDSDLESMELAETELLAKIAQLENRIARAPMLENELNRLNRQYDNAVEEYRAIREKERAAELAESLERDRHGERLSLIEPANLPETAERSRRAIIGFLSFLLAVSSGVSIIALRETMDTTVHSSRALADLVGEQPLSAIPYHRTRPERRAQSWQRFGFAMTIVCLITVGIALVHRNYMPLDALWYAVMHRLGFQVT